ncbi:hypothetical protein ACFFJI_10280 [Allobacillus sp. GCM10007491]|uniref:Uncharacterized protein n=1 Tax=Allobacillus saliphilus TaxID=2912308 RepID=A0A941CRT5_9BACI|nr:hypothetical protein [Allobacillus saliphilus]MBR7552612.1 hypothetical protein [Allobacillus saliphilus]
MGEVVSFVLVLIGIVFFMWKDLKKLKVREWIGFIISLVTAVAVGVIIIYFFGNWILDKIDHSTLHWILSWGIAIFGVVLASYIHFKLTKKFTNGKL